MRLLRPHLVLTSALLAACSSSPKGGEKSDAFLAPNREMVYVVAQQALRDQGFTPDREASSLENGIITTRWTESLQPFSHMGWRDMATVWIRDEVGSKPSKFHVEVQVVRERNDNQLQPDNPAAADWSDGERVPDLERLILARIKAHFVEGTVSEEFQRRRG